jgi:hypothetical protein
MLLRYKARVPEVNDQNAIQIRYGKTLGKTPEKTNKRGQNFSSRDRSV